jgi:hypothetical protein
MDIAVAVFVSVTVDVAVDDSGLQYPDDFKEHKTEKCFHDVMNKTFMYIILGHSAKRRVVVVLALNGALSCGIYIYILYKTIKCHR